MILCYGDWSLVILTGPMVCPPPVEHGLPVLTPQAQQRWFWETAKLPSDWLPTTAGVFAKVALQNDKKKKWLDMAASPSFTVETTCGERFGGMMIYDDPY